MPPGERQKLVIQSR